MGITFKLIKYAVLAAVILSGCIAARNDAEPARQALSSFFDQLSKGEYSEAAKLYGGSYEELAAFNPEINSSDTAALLKNACEINGFQCLSIRSVTFVEENPKGEFIFDVAFTATDGSLFILQPCCGEDVTNMEPRSIFTYHVVKGEDGKYRVQDLPVYVP